MKNAILLFGIPFFTGAFSLNVIGQIPSITTFSPHSDPGRTAVTITGANFHPVATNNIVCFGLIRHRVKGSIQFVR
jgi:hypothetical protein